jgi:glycerol-3-phosphate acyltransferase PlsY
MNIPLIAAGYLIGSIPFAWIFTKLATGQDIRGLGSGNAGVMNTALSTARWAGICVFLLEVAKGAVAVILSRRFAVSDINLILVILAAVVGTRWSLWLGFRGGRGNTAGVTGLILVSWQAAIVLAVIWIIVRLISGEAFLATRLSLILMPIVLGGLMSSWSFAVFGLALGLIYLSTQDEKTDDHLLIKQQWHSLWDFITSPRRK